jgi:fermentation-respiration switch protein FrsA (DUF1100 family)
MKMIGWAAAVILLIAALLWFWFRLLPEYLFGFVFKRKYPQPGSPAYEQAEAEALREESRLWIDAVPREEAGVTSRDGLTLKGWFLPGKGGSAGGVTMIMAHGYGGHPRQISSIVQALYEHSGYNILLPCARACGFSQGEYIGFGWLDRLDYPLWIDWVKERTAPDGPMGVILYGISMGSATVLMTAGEGLPPEVKAVISDCGYTSVYDELKHQMTLNYHFQNEGILRRVSEISKRKAGYSFKEASALEQVKKITIPVFFIHGDADTFVPTWMGHALYDACTAPKELYIAPNAGHGEACGNDPAEYRRLITQFLGKYGL